MNTGQRVNNSEVSSIDTAILLCGILTCRQHFQDQQIVDLATQIYQRIIWPWMLNGGSTFSMGWTPENGFLPTRWDTYSELMMLYLLVIGATANPIPASAWQAFARPSLTYQGLVRLSQQAGCLRQLLQQLHHCDASSQAVLFVARRSVLRLFEQTVGNHAVGLSERLCGVGRAAGDGAN